MRARRLLTPFALVVLLAVPTASFAGGNDDDDAPVAGPVTVSDIGSDSARLAATLTLGKGSASYWFEYATPGSPWTSTPLGWATHEMDDDAHAVSVTSPLGGLPAGTTFSVRLVAAGKDGTSTGPAAEFSTAPATSGGDPAPAPPAATPDLGETFAAGVEDGRVKVRLPGTDVFVDLATAGTLPVGTVVDARQGAMALTTALPEGGTQTGSFGGARFEVRQSVSGNGRTDLHLRGGSFAGCRAAARSAGRALATTAKRKRSKRVRGLWGKDDGGRFRTHGRDSVTTVRGTEWTVVDRCDGTLTRVAEGAVDVRVRRTGRTVRVDAGERFLAAHRR